MDKVSLTQPLIITDFVKAYVAHFDIIVIECLLEAHVTCTGEKR